MYITEKPICPGSFTGEAHASCGAVAVFLGVVRNHHQGKAVLALRYESYFGMADRQIGLIIRSAKEKWNVHEARVLHRTGNLAVGETAVAIAVQAPHRDEAFAACREIIERIKAEVPIWKKEFYTDGTYAWVSCAQMSHV